MLKYKQWLAVIIFVISGQAMAADELAQLIAEQKYQAAYALANELQIRRAGEPDFDFYYGLAALETGHAQQAVFALERVIALIPEDQRARAELARAHFELGNYEQAKYLFQRVLAAEPPPRVRDNIQRFLDQIEARNKRRDHQLSASIEWKLGYDSNVNSATEERRISLPIGLTLELGDYSRQLNDDFSDLTLGANYLQLLRKDMGYFLSASMNQRNNLQHNEFDVRQTGIGGGLIYKAGGHTIRLPLQYQYLQVDEAKFRATTSLGLEWNMAPIKNGQLIVFSQLARQRHIKSERIRDVDQTLLGLGYSHAFRRGAFSPSASIYLGLEKPKQDGGEHFGRQYQGWRLAGQWRIEGGHEFQLSFAAQTVKHDEVHIAFDELREDSFGQFGLEWGWNYDPQLRFGMALNLITNNSNIDIYTYNRLQQYFSARYRF